MATSLTGVDYSKQETHQLINIVERDKNNLTEDTGKGNWCPDFKTKLARSLGAIAELQRRGIEGY